MARSAFRRSGAWAFLSLLSACTAVGPNFTEPVVTTPSQWKHTGGDGDAAQAGRALDAADPTLTASAASAASAAWPASASLVAAGNAASGVPAVSAPASEADVNVPPAAHFEPHADPDPRWWRAFGDPTLDALIARAVSGNLDLKEAVLRISASRSQEQMARAAGLPSLDASAKFTREQLGLEGLLRDQGAYSSIDSLGAPGSTLNQASPGAGTQASQAGRNLVNGLTSPVNVYQMGFDASWELDLFGRVRRSVESANAQSAADIEQRNDALVSLEAEVARTYAQLRGAQAARQVTRDLVASEKSALALTQSQQKSGLASDIDVQQAQVQVETSQAELPQYEQQIDQAMNALAVLVGEAPGALDATLSAPGAIPPVPPTVPVGLPASLARRRPDIRRAEANLHAATAEVGVATAQLFPEVSLTGSFGFRSLEAKHIANWANHFYSFGPGISLPIFHGGQIVANIRMSKAQQAVAALDYRKTVLSALADVDNALVAYQSEHERRVALARSVASTEKTLEISENGYQHGLTSFINVLNAETSLAQNRASLVQSMLTETTDLVAVYKALGGGWQDAQAEPLPVGTLGNAGMAAAQPAKTGVGSAAAAQNADVGTPSATH